MDKKKSVDEKFLAVRKKISTCDDAMLAAVDLGSTIFDLAYGKE